MLLIALLGPVGSGKTTLLHRLADWWAGTGREPDGFLAEAVQRPPQGGGAGGYDLLMLKGVRRLSYASRDESVTPPYRFDEGTRAALDHWADGLVNGTPPSLIVLDELGPMEAGGGGHIRLWPRILSAKPEIVVVAARQGLQEAFEARLGRRFDVEIDVTSPDALERVQQACAAHSDWMRVGLYGGGAGGFEASVGAILHGGQIPLRGLFMSSIQSVIMTYAANGLGLRRRVVWVSFLAASIKAFSPTGNRFRPMLAITVQGILYTLAITLLGWNIAGAAAGGFLIGAWAALQGVALQYLFVGNKLLRAYDTIIQWIAGQLEVKAIGFLALVAGWTILCGLATGVVTVLAWNRRQKMPARLRAAMFRTAKGVRLDGTPASIPEALHRGLRDILRPLFWLPVAIVGAVMLATGSSLESILWVVVRAAGVGFVLFSVVRAFDAGRFMRWLQRRGYWGPALAYHRALHRLQTSDQSSPDSKT